MYTKEILLSHLKKSGVPQDRPVLVHTSLKKIGPVEGGAETVLSTLREHITAHGGILMIPTHTWDNFMEGKEYTLDLSHHMPCLGVLPMIAAAHPSAIISENPTHSIAFFGDRERILSYIEPERRVITPASPVGCYGKLAEERGEVLLLGVDQTKNTFLHALEEKFLGNIRYTKEPVLMKIRYGDGSVAKRPFYAFDESKIGDVSERFEKFDPPFRKYGAVFDGVFGNAKTRLCNAKKMEKVLEMIYRKAAGKELLADLDPIPEAWY